MAYCARCQGILSDKQTILPGEKEGESVHYFCAWRIEQERKEALLKGGEDANKVRARSWPFNTLPSK